MNHLKAKLCIFLLILVFPLSGDETIYLLTLPKCGTLCTEKYFKLLEHIDRSPLCKIRRSHLSENYLGLPVSYFENEDVKKIVVVRDLRDMFISQLYHIEKCKHYLETQVIFTSAWRFLSFEQKLLQLIDYERKPAGLKWKYHNRTLPVQTKKMVRKAIALSQLPGTLQVKYEDLSGGHGVEAQKAVFRKINSYVGIATTEQEEEFLVTYLHGNNLIPSDTFREGKVYKWKSLMSPSLCEIFKSLYGQELIDLGYEQDRTWTSDIS